ncbi:MAG: type II secretion system protein [Planctomycetota bacterium]
MKRRSAFTLVELVVVIMILGILAGVAAPKLLNTSASATENSLRTTLSVVRDAIELYAAQNGGAFPGTGIDFKTDLQDYIRGDFPICNVAGTPNADVAIVTDAAPTVGGTEGWKFSSTSGAFICNVTGYETF